MPFAGAIGFAIVSAVANGSFGVFAKLKPVQDAEVPSPLFNLFVGMGFALEAMAVFLFYWLFTSSGPPFTVWGLLSGALFVFSTAATFVAIQCIGLGVASGVWCGTSVIVSFCFGLGSGEQLSHPLFAAVAILVILGGIAGIASANMTSEGLREDSIGNGEFDEEYRLVGVQSGDADEVWASSQTRFIQGFSAAFVAGSFGGLILAPMSSAPESQQGLRFMASMGLGVILVSPPVTALCLYLYGGGTPSTDKVKVSALFGIISGCIWGIGNAASIIAVQSGAGLAVAYPVMQAGLFIAGMWGIFLFHELHRKAQPIYWASGAVLMMGVALLVASK